MYKLCRTCERRIATIEFWSGENDHWNNMWSWFYNVDIPSKVSKVLQIFSRKSCGNTPMPKPRTWDADWLFGARHTSEVWCIPSMSLEGVDMWSALHLNTTKAQELWVGNYQHGKRREALQWQKWVSDRIQKCCGQQILPSAAIANGWKLQQVLLQIQIKDR